MIPMMVGFYMACCKKAVGRWVMFYSYFSWILFFVCFTIVLMVAGPGAMENQMMQISNLFGNDPS